MDYKRVLILHYTNGMSSRKIAEATGAGKTTINEFLKRFRECGELSYPLSADVTNEFIGDCLYKKAGNPVNSDLYRDFNPEDVHRALTRKGETLKHLWKKYNATGTVNGCKKRARRCSPAGSALPQSCNLLSKRCSLLSYSMVRGDRFFSRLCRMNWSIAYSSVILPTPCTCFVLILAI